MTLCDQALLDAYQASRHLPAVERDRWLAAVDRAFNEASGQIRNHTGALITTALAMP